MRALNTADIKSWLSSLRVGDEVLLSGTVYTARDAVHKRFAQLIAEGKPLPIEMEGAVIYYAGPTPAKNGLAVGSCGPTTSSRMDKHTPMLLERGLSAIIGKGERNESVISSLKENGAVYFCAIGGAGALYASCIESVEVVAFEELGCESLKKMTVKDLPLIVGVDSYGGNIFDRKKA
ncbi:MAG: fumarate hydratase C-terminal domain-containing protein [Clostridia bacterium]|nr:fumarate hydratase C-terminal domain-containing protein [Clostridia bacterium]